MIKPEAISQAWKTHQQPRKEKIKGKKKATGERKKMRVHEMGDMNESHHSRNPAFTILVRFITVLL